ncbi:MAG: DUF2177 family protein [Chitinophagales bacterium]
MGHIIHYFLTALIFFAIDILWLGFIGQPVYKKYLGHLMAPEVNWLSAIIFYLLFIFGILIFAVYPAIGQQSLKYAASYGALFGFFTYMTYELTNHAVIKDWPLGIVPIDIIWGTVLSCAVAIGSYYVAVWLKL